MVYTISDVKVYNTSTAWSDANGKINSVTIDKSLKGDITINSDIPDNFVGKEFKVTVSSAISGKSETIQVYQFPPLYLTLQQNSQSVNAGEKISSGSKITLYIPKMVIKYPDFVADNWEIKRIEEYSEKYGIKLEIVPIYDNTKEVGTILSQRPKANEEVFEGDVLKIGVVKHEEETTKPEVTTTKENTTTTKGEQ